MVRVLLIELKNPRLMFLILFWIYLQLLSFDSAAA